MEEGWYHFLCSINIFTFKNVIITSYHWYFIVAGEELCDILNKLGFNINDLSESTKQNLKDLFDDDEVNNF